MKILSPFLFVLLITTIVSLATFTLAQFMTMDKADNMAKKLEEAEKKMKESRMKRASAAGLNNDEMWMDGLEEDVELNCPSMKYTRSKDFAPPKKQITSSIRCATCNLMKEFMLRRAKLQVLKGRKPSPAFILEGDDDGTKSEMNKYAGGELCPAIYDSYQMKEQLDGERVWARRFGDKKDQYDPEKKKKKQQAGDDVVSPEEKKMSALAADKEALMKTHLVSTSGAPLDEDELLPVKFHNPEQRRTLPCSRYFLRELCFDEVGKKEEALEGCFEKISSMKLEKLIQDNKDKQEWVTTLDKCLDKALNCEKKFCHARALANVRKQEWLEFAWYEGAFGNEKFSYIPELEYKGRNMLNPYRKGGEQENLNPWLNGTWKQVETESMLGDL